MEIFHIFHIFNSMICPMHPQYTHMLHVSHHWILFSSLASNSLEFEHGSLTKIFVIPNKYGCTYALKNITKSNIFDTIFDTISFNTKNTIPYFSSNLFHIQYTHYI